MKKVKIYLKYAFLFIFFFLILSIFGFYNNSYDAFWNYSFSYGIARGEVPYIDFNTVSTPFSSFFTSLFLIFNHNYIFYILGWSLILTFTFYLLFKLLGNKSYIVLFSLLFPFLHTIIPTYNLFAFCLYILLIYLESNKKSNYLIGLVLGFLLLTKHTVGIFFVLCNLIYYIKNFNIIKKRFIGFIIPCIIFLIYLLFTGSVSQFIDLCILGLFDFSKSSSISYLYFSLSIVLLIFYLIYILKNKRDINSYYALCTFSFVIPLFDSYHFLLFFNSLLIYFLLKVNISYKEIYKIFLILSCTLCICNFLLYDGLSSKRLDFLPNLKYYLVNKNEYSILKDMNKIFLKYYNEDNIPIILSTKSAFIYTGNDIDVNYYLVYLKGNYGYNGTSKLINRVRRSNKYFIINKEEMNEIGNNGEYLYEVSKYVTNNFKLVDEYNNYQVYKKLER